MSPTGYVPPHFSPMRQERNPLELLTMAAIESIPSTVLFVIDSSGTSQPLPDQLRVRAEMRRVFATRLDSHPAGWIDVLSKTDLRPVGSTLSGGVHATMLGEEADQNYSRTWIDRALGGSLCLRRDRIGNRPCPTGIAF